MPLAAQSYSYAKNGVTHQEFENAIKQMTVQVQQMEQQLSRQTSKQIWEDFQSQLQQINSIQRSVKRMPYL
ncbi:hypothetical protein [Lentibacillus sediminis]|uniref:hypothetical protein n=1 Tax=Lentibacillus sediminis TaxID=1940529 RepID=UPI000C1BEAC8|nr:hypothetical protein [Lentibacillus sediminis]